MGMEVCKRIQDVFAKNTRIFVSICTDVEDINLQFSHTAYIYTRYTYNQKYWYLGTGLH